MRRVLPQMTVLISISVSAAATVCAVGYQNQRPPRRFRTPVWVRAPVWVWARVRARMRARVRARLRLWRLQQVLAVSKSKRDVCSRC